LSPEDELAPVNVLELEGQKILAGFADVVLDPSCVDQLYNANPLVLTKAQRAVVIETIRRHRAERTAKKAARKTKVKATKEELAGISLDDLGALDIE